MHIPKWTVFVALVVLLAVGPMVGSNPFVPT